MRARTQPTPADGRPGVRQEPRPPAAAAPSRARSGLRRSAGFVQRSRPPRTGTAPALAAPCAPGLRRVLAVHLSSTADRVAPGGQRSGPFPDDQPTAWMRLPVASWARSRPVRLLFEALDVGAECVLPGRRHPHGGPGSGGGGTRAIRGGPESSSPESLCVAACRDRAGVPASSPSRRVPPGTKTRSAARDGRPGCAARRPQQGGGGLRAVEPVRAPAATHGRLGRLPPRTAPSPRLVTAVGIVFDRPGYDGPTIRTRPRLRYGHHRNAACPHDGGECANPRTRGFYAWPLGSHP